MSRAPRRIDFAKFPGGPGFELDKDQRSAIEKSYGHPISASTWEEIFEVTSNYTIPETELERAPLVEVIRTRLKALVKASTSLRKTIMRVEPSDRPRDDINELFEFYFGRLQRPTKGNLFEFYVQLLDGVVAYSKFVDTQLNNGYVRGYKNSFGWDRWIVEMTAVLEREGPPTGASHSKIEGAPASAFVTLIKMLQEHMPQECRRHQKITDQSLAAVISKARR